MTDSNSTLNDVPGLLEERRRYEAWLAALEMRRDSTAAHVFDRVHADYSARLRRVSEELASHRQSILEERTSVQSRMSLLEAEEQLRRDERAELDLRVHVGELNGSEAEEAFRAVDDTLRHLHGEREGLGRRLTDLDGLLVDRTPEPAPAKAPERHAAEPTRVAEAASAATRVREPATAQAAPQPGAPAAAPQPRPPAAAPPQSADGGAQQPSGASFDELAFLTQVVGGEQQPLVRSDSVADSLLDGLEQRNRGGAREAPLAANVSSNTPIVLRTSGPIEQSKTLKCSECGALNYPTEWYCERCGAELAAL